MRAILTPEQKRDIVVKYFGRTGESNGGLTQRAIADQYGVSAATISMNIKYTSYMYMIRISELKRQGMPEYQIANELKIPVDVIGAIRTYVMDRMMYMK